MIPLRFFRDKTHVYINNPQGITKQMTIAEFEAMLNGSGGAGGAGLVVHELYNSDDDYTYLDKTFAEILDATKNGVVLVLQTYEDETVEMVNSSVVTYAGTASNGADNIVVVLCAVESDNNISFVSTIYSEDDGVLKFSQNSSMPLPAYTFTVGTNDINASPSRIFTFLTAGNNCYFSDLGAGTNNTKNYTIVEYGNTGTTYYLKLSNGETYSGLWNADKMTKVVNP